jgi:hypothetical protein
MNFTTVAARSSAIPTPTTGMVSYVGDTGSDSATGATIVDVPQIQAYTGSAWQNMDGLTLIAKANIGTTVSSVVVSNIFNATYDAYKIIISGGVGSTGANLQLRVGGASSNYAHGVILLTYSTAAVGGASEASGAQFGFIGSMATTYLNVNCDLVNPFLAKPTYMGANYAGTGQGGLSAGVHTTATSYTEFSIFPSSGTMTGGTIYVYGYRSA